MGIQFQICGLIIVALIHIIYATHRRLRLRSERVFSRALYLTMLMLYLDISSVMAIKYMDFLPQLLVHAICKAYEVSLIFCSGTILVYLLAAVLNSNQFRKLNIVMFFILVGESILTWCHSIQINPLGYAYGPGIDTGYGVFAINFAVTIFFLGKYFWTLRRRMRFGIALWIGLWVAFALIQMYNPTFLLAGLAVSLGVLILFALLEKPEAKLEKQYGCFNYFALLNYLDEMTESNIPVSLLSVSLKTSGTLTGDNLYREASHVLKVLKRHKDAWIFRGISQDFICISKQKAPIEALSVDLEEESRLFPKESCYARITRCYDTSSFGSANEILQFLNFAKSRDNEQTRIFDASTELKQSYHNKKQVEVELRNALVEDRIETFFQPIYSVREKRITSCEALARIRKNDGSILMPGEFIPIAEENGTILELGYKIFEQVCIFLSDHSDIVEYIEVNLSVVQCDDSSMADKLIEIMESHKVHPKKINLEITETASIVTKQKLLKNMERLLEYGVTFSLDDFGKGESNLMYVVDMPISVVKLDFDMSKSYFRSDKAKYVVNAVEGMSHGLNLKLVAEGIETAEELEAMEKQRIDYIQGYYFSRPLPHDEFVDFVQNYNATRQQESLADHDESIEKFRPT